MNNSTGKKSYCLPQMKNEGKMIAMKYSVARESL